MKHYKNTTERIGESVQNYAIQIAERYGFDNQAQQLIEEMAELTKAICKQFRINGKGQPVRNMSAEEVEDNLIEELADVRLVLGQVIYLMDCEDEVENIEKQKITRTFEIYDLLSETQKRHNKNTFLDYNIFVVKKH